MTIEATDQIPLDHFSGASNVTGDTVDDLRGIINTMKQGNPRAYIGIVRAQANLDLDDHVEWDTASIQGSLIAVTSGAGQLAGIITLTAGHTYRIGVGLDIGFDSVTGFMTVQVFNRTLSAKLIPDGGAIDPRMNFLGANAASTEVGMPVTQFEFTPSVDTDIDVRFEAVGGSAALDFLNNSCWMTIDAMN